MPTQEMLAEAQTKDVSNENTLVIDLDRCSGCDSCVAACKMENQMNLGVVRNHVSAVGPVGTFPDIEMYWLPMQCQQCDEPGCIEVCPTGAPTATRRPASCS